MKILLIGNKTVKDYAGAKTQYMFNTLTGAGADVGLYDIHSSTEIPTGIGMSVYMPWIETLDKTWAKFLRIIPGRRVLYTDNWYWYDRISGEMIEKDIDLDGLFHVVGFGSSENARWWPKAKFEWWGVLVDEDLAIPRGDQGYIWVDEIWPVGWCTGLYSANDVLNIAIPKIKERFGVSVLSQMPKDPQTYQPTWVDQYVPRDQDLEQMLSILAGARAFFTSHHECLGLMQFESMVCGVPVITNPTFSKQETFLAGEECAHQWTWGKNDDGQEYTDIREAAERMILAFEAAIQQDRAKVRELAVARYGKQAFIDRTNILGKK